MVHVALTPKPLEDILEIDNPRGPPPNRNIYHNRILGYSGPARNL